MDPTTMRLAREAQLRAMAETLELPGDALIAAMGPHLDGGRGYLEVCFDGAFRWLRVGTRGRGRDAVEAVKGELGDSPEESLAAGLASGASRALRFATAGSASTAPDLALGGAWESGDVAAAWQSADLGAVDWEAVCALHAAVGGGSFDLVEAGPAKASLRFDVSVRAEGRDDALEAIVEGAALRGVTALQRGLLRRTLEAWTPRPMNHLSLRLHVSQGALQPGLDVAVRDVPSEFAVVALQTGRPHPDAGRLYGILEGVLMPDRAVAALVYLELGPDEPARVSAVLESARVPE